MISKYSVRKPYTVLVAVVLVIVLGVVSLMKMTTDLLPEMSFQYALIITTDVGASPEKVESDVTAPIEAAMATTSNIKNITSTSYNSYSMVVLEYAQTANMDSVVIEIQQKLDQLSGNWDERVGTPMIMQINPDMLPIMVAAVNMEGMDQSELARYVDNELIPSLESVEGVASVSASGAITETVEITIDADKVAALNDKMQASISDKFADGRREITDGQKKIKDGQEAIAGSGDELGKTFDEVTNQREELFASRADLEKKLTELNNQKDSVASLQNSINTTLQTYMQDVIGPTATLTAADGVIKGVNTALGQTPMASLPGYYAISYDNLQILIDGKTDALSAGAPAVYDQTYMGMNANLYDYHAYYALQQGITAAVSQASAQGMNLGFTTPETMLTAMTEANSSISSIDQAVAMTYKPMGDALKGMGISITKYSDLQGALGKVSELLTKINSGKATMETALAQIDEGLISLDTALDTINEQGTIASIQVGATSAELATAAKALEDALSTLDKTESDALDQADMKGILTVDTISGLLVAQNFDMPAGYAKDEEKSYLIHVGQGVETYEELKDLVLMDFGTDEVGLVRLSDVADVQMVNNADETYAVVDGKPGIMLSVEKQTGYSTGDVTDRLLDRFRMLETANENLSLSVFMNQGVYIDMVVKSVFENMIIGAVLAILVLFLFLKDIRPTIIIACSIPLSVITAVVLMYFTGITLNILSMSGLVLGIGMLVDNSIVVIENIYRLRGEGMSLKKAAVEGASQVTGAIVASTLTTVSVYAPIVFTEGITRQLFVDLALTITFTLGASLLVALTFVPALSSAMLRKSEPKEYVWFEKFRAWYGRFLGKCLGHKGLVFLLSVVLLLGSGAAALSRGLNFMDMDMETDQLTVTIQAREDETLEFAELAACSDEVMSRIEDVEGIKSIGAMAGGDQTMNLLGGGSDSVSMYVIVDLDVTTLSQVQEEITKRTENMECAVNLSSSSMDYTAFFGSGLSVEIKGNDLEKLQQLAGEVAAVLERTEGVDKVEDGLDNVAPQFTITVDKEKAAEYGLTVAQVFQLVYEKMATSTSATTLTTDIRDYEVYVQTQNQSDTRLSDIEELTFSYTDKEGNEEEIPLKRICTMRETTTLSQIQRDSQSRIITVSASIDEDHNVSLVSNKVQKSLEKLSIPEGYSVKMTGEDETINDAMKQMLLMMLLAVIFIYLIMVAQFQSLLSPFIIMFSIPLAFTGGFLGLFVFGYEVSVIAMLGFIMLAGLIVNNGIVLIDYINQSRREGKDKHTAIVEAGQIRMRPILMTAMTTILAMLTSAIGLGESSAMMQPMAITMIGGLIYGTMLTLIVIPCIYDAFNNEKDMREEEI